MTEAARPSTATCVAVLGLGEAGGAIAADLIAVGARVRGHDPAVTAAGGIADCADEAGAVRGADVVLSANNAEDAEGALRAGIEAAGTGAVWADLNTAAPAVKRTLAELAAGAGVPFADVALMAPVPGKGVATPALASGPGAGRYADLLTPLGGRVTVLDGPAGLAATRKLLRSVFYKGMAAAVGEALDGARAAGLADWLEPHIAAELEAASAALVERLETGSRRHAVRRRAEMAAAVDLLTELGVPPRIAAASRDRLADLAERPET